MSRKHIKEEPLSPHSYKESYRHRHESDSKHRDTERTHIKSIKKEPLSDNEEADKQSRSDRYSRSHYSSKHRHSRQEEYRHRHSGKRSRENSRERSPAAHHKKMPPSGGRRELYKPEPNEHLKREMKYEKYEGAENSKWMRNESFAADSKGPPVEKVRATMALSGKLTAETNTYKGVIIKYSEPPEARPCPIRWRLYPFKDQESLPVLHLHRQTGYLIGRDKKVCDISMDHPSISKQHAAIQYRQVLDEDEQSVVRPYIIDLESANGTYLNSEKIQTRVYVELRPEDVLRFGYSSRDYVVMVAPS